MWLIAFIIILVFFVLAAFFSGMETGLISLGQLKLSGPLGKENSSKTISKFDKQANKFFATTLIGANFSLIIITSLGILLLFYSRKQINLSNELFILILTGFVLIFTEIIPKALFRDNAKKMVKNSYPLINFFAIIFKPFLGIVNVLDSSISKLFKLPEDGNLQNITKEDLSYMLSQTENDGQLLENQREMLEEVLEFKDLKAENVMIHRTEIVALPQDMPVQDILALAKKEGFTRFPVYNEDLDNIIGILIIYDIMKRNRHDGLTAFDFVREAYFAPESIDVTTLLTEMQTYKKSMVIIVDSFGGTSGIVTIEDILEEIVGEIEDEYDNTAQEVEKLDENNYKVQGYVEIDFLNDEYDLNIPEGDYETIAGLVIDRLARIPKQGTTIQAGAWKIKVLQVTDKKIVTVALEKNPASYNYEQNN
ncbi:MAG TPA: HlyC/CorC family transporter [Candidatus Cloacimonas sp.]|jgi:putative hemolysin|nr:magnesium and cobalt exporter, family [Candidatus Cloacimonadota bacterium]HCX72585.1 HlyC/CorC family transporter [Candidatus Cloacimonas sp.]